MAPAMRTCLWLVALAWAFATSTVAAQTILITGANSGIGLELTMRPTPRQGGGQVRNLSGTYMHIYQRQPDGSWALTRAMAATAEEN